ncbi:hypothetical protein J2X01_002964 [Arthrobacter ginsengisoli]|uniref:Uncharacterized protein n=1 Tax=Arthrobacter ginsengisoli TaxID=1356565 RepID=A0ABU1UEP1_9MICC|nr:hypothetical protein [Arthrobacter ginsengisoli]MDR7083669.1 hypothetical protein [Arthrobacter ginsengisoli]
MSIRELHVSRGFYGAETLPLTADDLGAVPAALGAETGNRNDTAEIDALRQGLKSSNEGAVKTYGPINRLPSDMPDASMKPQRSHPVTGDPARRSDPPARPVGPS